MFLYENEICPVCNEVFAEGDDVVVCPECATPHHRECYNKLGHCANKNKHKDGYEFKKGENAADKNVSDDILQEDELIEITLNKNVQSEQGYTAYQQSQSTKTVCTKCGKQINKNAPLCYNCGHKQENPDYGARVRAVNTVVYNDNDETIDNYRVRDVVAVVKSNTHRFINKFKSGKKFSWNWGAFFFGPYYLFFRKMNLQGAMALAVNAIISFVVSGLYIKQSNAFFQIYAGVAEIFTKEREKNANQLPSLSPQLMQELTDAAYELLPAILILIVLTLAVNIVIALIADNLYKKKVFQLISKCDEKSKELSLMLSIPGLQSEDDMDMSEEGNRTAYLSALGGVSIFAPVAAYCAYNIILQFISR